jgi:acyl-CoA synthetase (AMP-forming)/AMP-acid ligase II
MFFGDWLQRREMLSPSKVALIDAINNDQALTYRQWNQRTNRLVHYLKEGLGITKGDRVSIYSTNRVESLETLFSCNKLGAILQVINWRHTPGELVDIINDAIPKVMIYSQEWREQVRELEPKLSSVEAYINLDDNVLGKDTSWLNDHLRVWRWLCLGCSLCQMGSN